MKLAKIMLALLVCVVSSTGCVSMKVASKLDDRKPTNPLLTDEIVAIGKPDAELAKELGQENVVALIGLKNTYLLYKGGEELVKIAQLKLDGRYMGTDASWSRKLYLKDNHVWGDLTLLYGGRSTSPEDKSELEKGGFTTAWGNKLFAYQKKIYIEGAIYPAINIPDEQLSKLIARQKFNLDDPDKLSTSPSFVEEILKIPVIAGTFLVDIVLIPVYAVSTGWIVTGIMIHPPR